MRSRISNASRQSKISEFMRRTHEIKNLKTGESLQLTPEILVLLEQLSRDLDLDKLSEQ